MSSYYICVLILYVSSYYMCPHTMCPHTTCVLILYMCSVAVGEGGRLHFINISFFLKKNWARRPSRRPQGLEAVQRKPSRCVGER